MATVLRMNMDVFKQNVVERTLAAGYNVAALQALQGRVLARTEATPEGDAIARIVSLALFAACTPVNEPSTGPVAVFLEDRITGVVTPKP